MQGLIDDDAKAENRAWIFAVGNVNTIDIGPGKKLLANRCHHRAVLCDVEIVLDKISVHRVLGSGRFNVKLGLHQRELLLDTEEQLGSVLGPLVNFVRFQEVDRLLLDEVKLISFHVLERQLITPRDDLALHLVHLIFVLVLDLERVLERPNVFSDRELHVVDCFACDLVVARSD